MSSPSFPLGRLLEIEWKPQVIYFKLSGHIVKQIMTVDECLSFTLIILPVDCSVWGPLLHCVHHVSSFSSYWKEFRSWSSPLAFASSSSNQQRSFCFWETILDRTYLGYFARQCGFFSFAKRCFLKTFSHIRAKCGWDGQLQLWDGSDLAWGCSQRSMSALLSGSCFHLQDTAKSQHFPLAYNAFFSSVPEML